MRIPSVLLSIAALVAAAVPSSADQTWLVQDGTATFSLTEGTLQSFGFEIVDSRIRDWKIRIQDTVADNASCGVFVLGDAEADPRAFDLPNLRVRVYKNGEPLSEGLGSAVQGNPLTAVAWLANTLGRYDIPFRAGDIILSGSVVPLEPVVAGDTMHCEVEGLGSASCSFV